MPSRENVIAKSIVDAAYTVHTRLGPGLLESVYEAALEVELKRRGHNVEHQVPIPVYYDEVKLECGFRADLIVEGIVIIEIKSLEVLPAVTYKIALTYLKVTELKLCLVINFGEELIKDGIRRVVNNLRELD